MPMVPMHELVLEEAVGRGAYGVVRLARWNGKKIIVKVRVQCRLVALLMFSGTNLCPW